MPARKWIQRSSISMFVLMSCGKLIWGAKKDVKAAPAIVPPEILPRPLPRKRTTKKSHCVTRGSNRLRRGLYTTAGVIGGRRAGKPSRRERKPVSTDSRLKSAGGRRMVLAATCQAAQPRETVAAKRQATPPVPGAERPQGTCCCVELARKTADRAGWCVGVQ